MNHLVVALVTAIRPTRRITAQNVTDTAATPVSGTRTGVGPAESAGNVRGSYRQPESGGNSESVLVGQQGRCAGLFMHRAIAALCSGGGERWKPEGVAFVWRNGSELSEDVGGIRGDRVSGTNGESGWTERGRKA